MSYLFYFLISLGELTFAAFVDVTPEETLRDNPFGSFKELDENDLSKDSLFHTKVRA